MNPKIRLIGFTASMIFLATSLCAATLEVKPRTMTPLKPVTTVKPSVKSSVEKKLPNHLATKSKPDLTITRMMIHPAHPAPGDLVRFSAEVVNNGLAAAPASKAGIKIGGETFPVLFNLPQIPANGSTKLIRHLKMDKEGNYIVRFIADADKKVAESNENNNMGLKKFTVAIEPFVIADESMLTYSYPSMHNFTFYLRPSKPVDTTTVNNNAIQVRIRKYVNDQLSSEAILTGSFTRPSFMEWRSDTTNYAGSCAGINSYCLVDVTLKDSLRAQDGGQLDGNGDGLPGGNYHHQFRR